MATAQEFGAVPVGVSDQSSAALELGKGNIEVALFKHMEDDRHAQDAIWKQLGQVHGLRNYARGIIATLVVLFAGLAVAVPYLLRLAVNDAVSPQVQRVHDEATAIKTEMANDRRYIEVKISDLANQVSALSRQGHQPAPPARRRSER